MGYWRPEKASFLHDTEPKWIHACRRGPQHQCEGLGGRSSACSSGYSPSAPHYSRLADIVTPLISQSGAIIQYLLDTYDTNRHLTFPLSSAQEHASSLQYQWFQATFQGPNLSAVLRFTRFTPNKEARQRFTDESLRVLRVLEGDLQRNSTGWLVGAKCSAADLVFVPYMWSLAVT